MKMIHKLEISSLVLFHIDPIIINRVTNIFQKYGVGGGTIYEINGTGRTKREVDIKSIAKCKSCLFFS
jgi:hypothetical protein